MISILEFNGAVLICEFGTVRSVDGIYIVMTNQIRELMATENKVVPHVSRHPERFV